MPSSFTHCSYVVFGLARSGMATVQWLLEQGSKVLVLDNNPQLVENALAKGATAINEYNMDWSGITAVVQSPGIPYLPHPHPFTQQALDRSIPVISDMDLLQQENPQAIFVGITGTNGKSTTTALVGHILQTAGRCVAVGGNIGTPALSLPPLESTGIYVLELSSYQLDLSRHLTFHTSAFINLTEDHLERHKTLDNYSHAKKAIFNKATFKIIGVDTPYTQALYRTLQDDPSVIPVSVNSPQESGIFVSKNTLIDSIEGEPVDIINFSLIKKLKGLHNQENIAIAYGVCRSIGLEKNDIIKGILSFPGLDHRQEWVTTFEGVEFINDSKATNASAAAHALTAFDSIFWIVGGQDKSDGIDSLSPYFPKIKQAFLIGEAAHRFSKTLNGKVPYHLCYTLEAAVQKAFEQAKAYKLLTPLKQEPVVLLSPACASFDQFTDFEHRGQCFKNLIKTLKPV